MKEFARLQRISYENGRGAGARDLIIKLNELMNKGQISNFIELKMFMIEETETIAKTLDQLRLELDSMHAEVS